MDSFATIMVGVIGYKEVYEAWENEFKSVIDDFKEEGAANAVQAESSNWLEQIPQVLCLQLNRLEYDEKHAEQVKSRHKVEIEKTLYVDRFMMQNKEKSEQISNKVKSLREQIKVLEQSIKEYTNFSGTDYEVIKMFELM